MSVVDRNLVVRLEVSDALQLVANVFASALLLVDSRTLTT